MQALVLAGGEGTRLRPLTLSVPKPVMPLAGRPFLTFMLDWLAAHGVDDAILSCGFLSTAVEEVLGDRHGSVALRYVVEEEPLSTAGPVRLAGDRGLLAERFLVLNGDALTDIDLTAEIEQHERTGATATLALIAVSDTTSYGVVPTASTSRRARFADRRGLHPERRQDRADGRARSPLLGRRRIDDRALGAARRRLGRERLPGVGRGARRGRARGGRRAHRRAHDRRGGRGRRRRGAAGRRDAHRARGSGRVSEGRGGCREARVA